MRPLDLAGLAACEQSILLNRSTPWDQCQEALATATADRDIRLWQALGVRAAQEMKKNRSWRCVSWEQMFGNATETGWINTPEGVGFTAWYCLGRGRAGNAAYANPLLARQQFVGAEAAARTRQFIRARDLVSALDMLATLDFPERSAVHPRTGRRIELPHRRGWHHVIRDFASGWNWTPKDVGRLLLYQLMVYQQEETNGRAPGTATVDAADIKKMAAMTPAERAAYARAKTAEH